MQITFFLFQNDWKVQGFMKITQDFTRPLRRPKSFPPYQSRMRIELLKNHKILFVCVCWWRHQIKINYIVRS